MTTSAPKLEAIPLSRAEAAHFLKDLRTLVLGVNYPQRAGFSAALVAMVRTFIRGHSSRVTQSSCRDLISRLTAFAERGRSEEARWFKDEVDRHKRRDRLTDPKFLDLVYQKTRSKGSHTMPNGLSFYEIKSFGVLITSSEDAEVYLSDGWLTHVYKDYTEFTKFLAEAWDQAKIIEIDKGLAAPSDLTLADCVSLADEWDEMVVDAMSRASSDLGPGI